MVRRARATTTRALDLRADDISSSRWIYSASDIQGWIQLSPSSGSSRSHDRRPSRRSRFCPPRIYFEQISAHFFISGECTCVRADNFSRCSIPCPVGLRLRHRRIGRAEWCWPPRACTCNHNRRGAVSRLIRTCRIRVLRHPSTRPVKSRSSPRPRGCLHLIALWVQPPSRKNIELSGAWYAR